MTMTPISWRVHRSLVEARESDLSTMIGHLATPSGVYAARFETLLPALRDAMMREKNLGELSIEE